MKLLIDLGNSRMKWACCSDGTLSRQGACDSTKAEFDNSAKPHWKELPVPEQVVYCAVAGQELAERLEALAQELWQLQVHRLVPQKQLLGLHCNYKKPEQLGADRWAAMIGAYSRIQNALCVVDCGTAVTVDALAADGRHQGGLIIPGRTLMRRALGDHTGAIGQVHEGGINPASVDTQGAVNTGCLLAVAAFIDSAVQIYQDMLVDPMQVLITGGDAGPILAHLKSQAREVPELVLLGLAEYAGLDV